MNNEFIAKVATTINAPIAKVWDALINPEMIKQYMPGTEAVSEWKEGSPITWKGEWEGKPYKDSGVILEMLPEAILRYLHFSPLAGLPDVPENYHMLTYSLSMEEGNHTFITLSQDNNTSKNEMDHAQGMWEKLLAELKKVLEK